MLSKIEQDLARSGASKLQRKETPTKREEAALKKFQKEKDSANLDRLVSSVPKGVYLDRVGVAQHKTLSDVERKWKVPVGSKRRTLNLWEVLSAFHELVAKYGSQLSSKHDTAEDIARKTHFDSIRAEFNAKSAELDYRAKMHEWLPRNEVEAGLLAYAGCLQRAGEQLKKLNPEALEILQEAIDDANHKVQTLLCRDPDPPGDDDGE